MRIGVPKEIKPDENRVALTPAGAHALVSAGHEVLVEAGAGFGSGFEDRDYIGAGATILPTADEVWSAADMIMKVKEPLPSEYPKMKRGLLLFTYLHLAAEPELTRALIENGVDAVAYETVELPSRALPLLTPMSEIAGGCRFRSALTPSRSATAAEASCWAACPEFSPARSLLSEEASWEPTRPRWLSGCGLR